ncbi:MAG: trypsin-like peptidase domain-containing protein [Clostridium sp.]|uniref:S1C family serine protease n=1 Tax=Clostridium sp. TaxID=1506 RepID=UPI002FC6C8F1
MNFNDFKGRNERSFFGYFAVGVIGAVIGAFMVLVLAPASMFPGSGSATPKPEVPNTQTTSVKITTDVSQVASKVSPSVVGVVTVNLERNLFDQTKEVPGVGSGVIVSDTGYILTNNHVADMKAKSITVMTHDGKEHKAVAIWTDPSLDLSVLKIEATGLIPASLGDSKVITVGEPAIAIGNPLGLTFQRTVTSGIVSAVNRTLEIERGVFMEDLIQTDASINPGNSGGPLLNIKGQVIGINTAKVSSAEGIGFAVPINIIKPVLDSIIATGSYKAPYIGLSGFDKEVAGYYKIDMKTGIYITEIDSRGPAAKILKPGQIIIEADGAPVTTMVEFKEILFKKKSGDIMKLKIQDGETVTETEITLK